MIISPNRIKIIHNKFLSEAKEISFINEVLGSFEKQPYIAKEITNAFGKMNRGEKNTSSIMVEIDGEIFNIILELKKFSLLDTHAQIVPYGEKDKIDYLKIDLYLSTRDNDLGIDEFINKKITAIINHELMHGNIFIKRLGNNQTIDIANWYWKIQKILETNVVDIVWNFAYAIYACYYQERQAIISSTYTQLLEKFDNKMILSIKEKTRQMSDGERYNYLLTLYKKFLVNTESYQTYYGIKTFINSLDNNGIEKIIEIFKNYGIEIKPQKEMKEIRKIAENALKDVVRNGSLFFHEFLLKNF